MPRFLLGLAIVFWGWQTGFGLISIVAAILVEAGQWNQNPWDLEETDFRRIANLCAILLLVLIGYLIIAQLWMEALYRFLLWLPLVFLPIVLAQVHSTQNRIPLKSLLILFDQHPRLRHTRLDLRYPYFGICIVSASAVVDVETQLLSYYLGMTVLVGAWVIFQRWQQLKGQQPQALRRTLALSLACFLCAASFGFVTQNSVHELHLKLENQAIQWLSSFLTQSLDPTERDTAIGKVGSLKLSNQILFRVSGQTVPPLLREASYNRYQAGVWVTIDGEFFPVSTDESATQWDLRPNAQQFLGQQLNPKSKSELKEPAPTITEPLKTIVIHDRLQNKKGLLKLPHTAQIVQNFPASGMNRNPYGTVKVESESDAVGYEVAFLETESNPLASLDQWPLAADLEVPPLEQSALRRILDEMGITSATPAPQAAQRMIEFFQAEFRYSLDLIEPPNRAAALQDFLLNHRSGHCEYFASAMALLLRELGIPARYAVGFSIHEFSPLEGQYVVRARHAHAWTIAYWNHHWVTLDPTPSDWRTAEAEAVPAWQKLQDWTSWLKFAFTQGFQNLRDSDLLRWWWWVIIPIVLIYIRQLNQRRRVVLKTSLNPPQGSLSPDYPGANSDFYQVIERLHLKGWIREPAETLKQWLDRLQHQFPEAEDWEALRSALERHYQERFDPNRG
jgi:transglutaminase-like putative cysteine protease